MPQGNDQVTALFPQLLCGSIGSLPQLPALQKSQASHILGGSAGDGLGRSQPQNTDFQVIFLDNRIGRDKIFAAGFDLYVGGNIGKQSL